MWGGVCKAVNCICLSGVCGARWGLQPCKAPGDQRWRCREMGEKEEEEKPRPRILRYDTLARLMRSLPDWLRVSGNVAAMCDAKHVKMKTCRACVSRLVIVGSSLRPPQLDVCLYSSLCVCVCVCACVCLCRLRWGPAETVPETDEADQARYGELRETERGVVRLYLYSFYFWKSWLLLIQDYGLILETATISSSCMWDCLSNDVLFCHMKIFCLIV